MIHARTCDEALITAILAHCSIAICVSAICGLVTLVVTQCSNATCVACIGGGIACAQCSAAIWVACISPYGGTTAHSSASSCVSCAAGLVAAHSSIRTCVMQASVMPLRPVQSWRC